MASLNIAPDRCNSQFCGERIDLERSGYGAHLNAEVGG
jgi:hypothetical protein